MVAKKVGAFHDHLVARADHGLAQQVQRLLTAGGDDKVFGNQVLHALSLHKGSQLFAQRIVAFGSAILQCGTRFMGQRGVDRLANAFHIKHCGVWEPPCKTDDAGLAQQFEKFTNSGSFHMIQAGGKLEWHGGLCVVAWLKWLPRDGSAWAAAPA